MFSHFSAKQNSKTNDFARILYFADEETNNKLIDLPYVTEVANDI